VKDATDITIVLDKSGSMDHVKDDASGSFDQFIEEQKAVEGECNVTLVLFNHTYEVSFTERPVKDVQSIKETYHPAGMTALLDAVGKAMFDTGERLKAKSDEERPDKVIFVVLTDGHENSSKEYQRETVKKNIEQQTSWSPTETDQYKWQMVFLGADIDAFDAGGALGVGVNQILAMGSNKKGYVEAFAATSKRVMSYRKGKSREVSFDAGDRERAQSTRKSS
jgi:hypothetical protein